MNLTNEYGKIHVFYYSQNSTLQQDWGQLGSLDYLVMTSILILSIAVSLGRNLSIKWSKNDESKPPAAEQLRRNDQEPRKRGLASSLKLTLGACLSNCYAVTNVLSLFGLSGEVINHGVGIQYFFVGILLSLPLILISGVIPVLTASKIRSLPHYLEKRFPGIPTARYLCIVASLIRYVCIGALSLHVAGIATSTMTNIHSGLAELLIGASALVCACVGGIQEVPESSISHLWILILSVTTLSTVSVTTSHEGGLAEFLSKASTIDYIKWSNSMADPIDRNSFWAFLSLGTIFGLQMFTLSPRSLKKAAKLHIGFFCMSLFCCSLVILTWLLLGTWAGVCCLVAFSGDESITSGSLHPDGALAKLILKQMGSIKGFRGFFVASLLASSISSMTIRCNQVSSLMWSFYHEFSKDSKRAPPSISAGLAMHSRNLTAALPDDLWKEIKWKENTNRRNRHLYFKATVGICFSSLMVGLSLGLQASSASVWEMWQGIVGLTSGSALGALFACLYMPCLTHMSVVVGLCGGWLASITLMFTHWLSYSSCSSFSSSGLASQEEVNSIEGAINCISTDGKMAPYCYQGLVGLFSSLIITSIATFFSHRCKRMPQGNSLVHPCFKRLAFCTSKPDSVRSFEQEPEFPGTSSREVPASGPVIFEVRVEMTDRDKILQVMQESSGI